MPGKIRHIVNIRLIEVERIIKKGIKKEEKMKRRKGPNRVDVLRNLIMETPIVYCLATASRTYPDATAEHILSEITKSNDPSSVVEKFGLLELFYNDRSIGFEKEDLLANYGGHVETLCPFHLDTERGSFKITPNKNMWWCFACTGEGGERGGSQISFEMDYYNLNFVDAVYHLAYRLGFISRKEYTRRGGGLSVNEEVVKQLQKSKRKEIRPEIKADPNIIHNVYSALQMSCPLSEEDRNHLINERGLDESDLVNYFTYPDGRVNLPKRILSCLYDQYSLKRFGRSYKDLTKDEKRVVNDSKAMKELVRQFKYVPGFYYDTRKKKHEAVTYRGFGLLSRDENGRVVGIQIRRKENGKGSRYLWLSSAFAQAEESYEGGASPSSPGGVIYPKNKPLEQAALCITEGRFTAEQIAKDGNLTVYLSGVGTWKNIQETITNVKGDRNKAYVMFDADMMGNTGVHAHLRSLSDWLKSQNITPSLIIWRKEYGKGYDDLKLQNPDNYKKLLKVISFSQFELLYTKALNFMLGKYKVSRVAEVEREKADEFTKELQSLIEKSLQLPQK